jgi:hypothetical protein
MARSRYRRATCRAIPSTFSEVFEEGQLHLDSQASENEIVRLGNRHRRGDQRLAFGQENLGDNRVVRVGSIGLSVHGARVQEQAHAAPGVPNAFSSTSDPL